MKETMRRWLLVAAAFMLNACGGGGGSPGACMGSAEVCYGSSNQQTTAPSTTIGPPSSYANKCTAEEEKSWVRAHLDDVYLWYDEIVDVPASSYNSASDYFYALLVRSRDRFSFTESQASIDQYFQSGEETGYGADFVLSSNRLRVAYTEPGTSAYQQNLMRGAEILAINGSDITSMSRDAQIAALYPDHAGVSNQFTVLDAGASSSRTITLLSSVIVRQPVLDSRIITAADGKKVGYLLFTDHIATAESQLISAMKTFQQQGIDDLVLDIRYNGGGFLYIASELATMIGGSTVEGKVFEKLQFNGKHPEKTADPDNTLDFLGTSSTDETLPRLNLPRVLVLTGSGTCSASESIINSLSPFIPVIRIGGTTCGKPYGMMQANNCGQAYFAIEFEGVNSLGQADYVNGFTPTCSASDDLEHALGDTNERLLKTALSYRTSNSCPAVGLTQSLSARYVPLPTLELPSHPWKSSRVLR